MVVVTDDKEDVENGAAGSVDTDTVTGGAEATSLAGNSGGGDAATTAAACAVPEEDVEPLVGAIELLVNCVTKMIQIDESLSNMMGANLITLYGCDDVDLSCDQIEKLAHEVATFWAEVMRKRFDLEHTLQANYQHHGLVKRILNCIKVVHRLDAEYACYLPIPESKE